jgi:hypothetical protein
MKSLINIIFITFLILLFLPRPIVAQNVINGNIKNVSNGNPIPYASIGILRKNVGSISDSSGYFIFELTKNLDYNDTVVISSIGYIDKKLRLQDFITKKDFLLEPTANLLKEISIASFKNERIFGSVSKKRNLNSGWSGSGKGGELGNIFTIGTNQYKIDMVSFYILTGCDTVWFRLHIREYENGYPGNELLTGNIILQVTKQDGISDHDLSKFNIYISDNPQIFLSLELIARSKSIADTDLGNNVHITGHKGGVLHYKWFPETAWLKNKDYELSLMLKAKY